MLSVALVVAAALLWLAALFAVALLGERKPGLLAAQWRHVYALSLAVYCTSWTFFGTVTQAGRYGWALPPTFVGTIALYALAAMAMLRLVGLAQASNATSIADLIATRLGKDPWLAATVTLVAALGLTPYIALQLMAVSSGFGLVTGTARDALQAPWRDLALYVALAMAVFAMAFGTRRASAAEHNRGLVLAMAFESLFKLAAMLALGLFVWLGLRLPAPQPVAETSASGFAPLVLLGVLAMFTLPHQFHVGVVECRDPAHVRTARWLFPLYLLLIALPILPLARAGQALLGASVPPDLYVLALPMAHGSGALTLLAFLGGLSAATGMVVVATLSLSLMIGHHWLLPWLSRSWARTGGGDLRGTVLATRRAVIVGIMLLAWGYTRLVDGNAALADVGALSFSALATLAPALAFAVWRPQTPPHAVLGGIVIAFATWGWCLPLPLLLGDAAPAWLANGPLGLRWLAPESFFGLTGWSPLARAVVGSLFLGVLSTLLLSRWHGRPGTGDAQGLDARTLRQLALRFLPDAQVDALLAGAPPAGAVPASMLAGLERELGAVLGAASVRVLFDAARHSAAHELEAVAAIVDTTSQHLRFNQRVLEAALENMSQGISVVDADLNLVAWNARYEQLFDYPPGLLQVGLPIAEATRWAMRRMRIDDADLEAALQRRLAHMRAGTAHLTERVFPDGAIVEIRGVPMPGGGFVATYTDVTAFRAAEADLKRSNETLEQRVGERTASLEAAKRDAEHANDAKSRFLAAIGHDLLQPLHAAHLFTDALHQRTREPEARALARQIDGALDSTTGLLTSLLDMSRLEAGGLVPEPRAVPLSEVLEPLLSEFRMLAADQGLALRSVATSAWVHTDPQLLRRVLQNFLANALRYTAHGGVLLGVRRDGARLRIEVHDTGPGIPEGQREALFEEFRRGPEAPGQGLGLGLSIAQRIAQLLEAPLSLRSRPGQGSVFAIAVQRTQPAPQPQPRAQGKGGLQGLRVLAVDNEPQALSALAGVLQGWGCEVTAVGDGDAAAAALRTQPADVWVLDYHLDQGDDGVSLYRRLLEIDGERPCLILSADQTGQVRVAAQEAGIPLIGKPLRPLALKSVLDRLLAARGIA